MKTDCTALIERMENLEERTGVLLQAIFAECHENEGQIDVSVRGEAHTRMGDTLTQDVEIVASAYDAQGRLIATSSSWMSSDSFFGFDTFDLSLFDIAGKPARLRLFPKFT